MKSPNMIQGEATNRNQRAERTTFNLFVFSLPLDRRHLHDTSRRGRMSEQYSLCLSLSLSSLFFYLPFCLIESFAHRSPIGRFRRRTST